MANQLPKGLKDLLDENVFETSNEEIIELPLDQIKPNPYQPRTTFDEAALDELADSIKENGIIQPIIVKKMNGYYAIVAGERRYRASKKAGLNVIPAIVRPYEKSKVIELALIENLQREDLSCVEEAKAYSQMMSELGYNHSEIAKKVGKSRSYVTNMVGLLSLPEEVISMIESKKLSAGHARALSKLNNKERILELAHLVILRGLSVRALEEILKTEEKTNEQKRQKKPVAIYEGLLKGTCKVKVKADGKKIIIRPKSNKQYEALLAILMEELN